MKDVLTVTLALYRRAFLSTLQSFRRAWVICVAVILFAAMMVAAMLLFGGMGLVGGLALGAVNALLIGATLSLVSHAVLGARRLDLQDIWASFGSHFWDVIGVGFVLWIPMMLLEQGLAANPYGRLLQAAVLLLLFILLNAVPEVIYQVRHDSPLEAMRESYLFVVENWIEWFLPLAIVLAPAGLSLFVELSGRLGRGAGLDFFQILVLPFLILQSWLSFAGIPSQVSTALLVILTPPAAVVILIFRGFLFAALHGSSRRQRLFQGGWDRES